MVTMGTKIMDIVQRRPKVPNDGEQGHLKDPSEDGKIPGAVTVKRAGGESRQGETAPLSDFSATTVCLKSLENSLHFWSIWLPESKNTTHSLFSMNQYSEAEAPFLEDIMEEEIEYPNFVAKAAEDFPFHASYEVQAAASCQM